MSIHMLGLAALAAAAPIAIFTTPALAAATEPASVAVPYRDLDLASEAGQAELDRRINRAARQVCGLDQQQTEPAYAPPNPANATARRGRPSIPAWRR